VQTCSSTFDSLTGVSTQSCSTQPGASASVFVLAASLDLVAVLRLTSSFNLMAGGAVDYALTATGSTTPSGTSATATAADVKGKYYGLQGWVGLGGYLL
jgi:hypothetical protein